jgi:hypothetical protein
MAELESVINLVRCCAGFTVLLTILFATPFVPLVLAAGWAHNLKRAEQFLHQFRVVSTQKRMTVILLVPVIAVIFAVILKGYPIFRLWMPFYSPFFVGDHPGWTLIALLGIVFLALLPANTQMRRRWISITALLALLIYAITLVSLALLLKISVVAPNVDGTLRFFNIIFNVFVSLAFLRAVTTPDMIGQQGRLILIIVSALLLAFIALLITLQTPDVGF